MFLILTTKFGLLCSLTLENIIAKSQYLLIWCKYYDVLIHLVNEIGENIVHCAVLVNF